MGGFKAEPGRYRLYVALICPWASRARIARKLKEPEELIPVNLVNPVLTDHGRRFCGYPAAGDGPPFGSSQMHDIYARADARFTGFATAPKLWDMKRNSMVNNESADIVHMFDTAFEELATSDLCLCPEDPEDGIDALNQGICDALNNGVYAAGFASSQVARDEAVDDIFSMPDDMETRLTGALLFEDRLTETDIRAFATPIRFDAAYPGLFKTNRPQIRDSPRLSAHVMRMLRFAGVRGADDMDHIVD